MAEEIKQRISLENAEAVEQQLRDVAGGEEQLAKAQGRVGNEAD